MTTPRRIVDGTVDLAALRARQTRDLAFERREREMDAAYEDGKLAGFGQDPAGEEAALWAKDPCVQCGRPSLRYERNPVGPVRYHYLIGADGEDATEDFYLCETCSKSPLHAKAVRDDRLLTAKWWIGGLAVSVLLACLAHWFGP